MTDRPYTLLSCSMSLDGYLDSPSEERLMLSNQADFDRVDAVRSGCDAIMVGARTVRKDNPCLQVRSRARILHRLASGHTPTPTKVTITASGRLDSDARFFQGEATKLVYCASGSVASTRRRLGSRASVVDGGQPVDLSLMCSDLGERGIRRLMVEGGGELHTQFLTSGLADELQLVIAPFFVGDSRARRFVGDGDFPWCPGRRATLADTERIDDVVLLRYALSSRFQDRRTQAR